MIGPQGVFEVATLQATHRGPFAGFEPTGEPVRLTLAIMFPWDAGQELFGGERIFLDRAALLPGLSR